MTSVALSTGRNLSREIGEEGQIYWELSSAYNYEGEAVTVFPDGEMGWGGEQEAGRSLWEGLEGIVPGQRHGATLEQVAGLLGEGS
jgi:hypothetical protein